MVKDNLGRYLEVPLNEKIIAALYKKGISANKLAIENNVTVHTILRRLRKNNIRVRDFTNRKDLPIKEIIEKYNNGESGREIARQYGTAVRPIYYHLNKHNIKMRTPLESRGGEKSWNWKGGRVKGSEGYILIKKREHPHANQDGYVPEHRLVMEKHIGRHLDPKERIHHINGIKTDNRIENLELYANESSHHKFIHIYPRKINLIINKLRQKYFLKEVCNYLEKM